MVCNFDHVKRKFYGAFNMVVYILAVIRPILNLLQLSYLKLIVCLYCCMLLKFSLSEHLSSEFLTVVSMWLLLKFLQHVCLSVCHTLALCYY